MTLVLEGVTFHLESRDQRHVVCNVGAVFSDEVRAEEGWRRPELDQAGLNYRLLAFKFIDLFFSLFRHELRDPIL